MNFPLSPGQELGKILKTIEEKIVKNELKNEQIAILTEVKKMLELENKSKQILLIEILEKNQLILYFC